MLTTIKEALAAFLENQLGSRIELSASEIKSLLEVPKSIDHGHLAFPVFFLAKKWRKAPPLIAKEISEELSQKAPDYVETVEAVAGFVNFKLGNRYLQDALMSCVNEQGDQLGFSDQGKGKRLVIDYSSPNVAKPMSIGHLRATVIGQAIYNLARTQGYEVVGLNHLGDWGVQFGKLAWAYIHWKDEYPFSEKPFESLYKLYVRFHEQAEIDEELDRQGSLTFKRLEEGDPQITEIWKMIVDISMKEYDRLWGLLGVRHDLVRGESFYNDRLKPTEQLLEKAGLLEESQGAMVVRLDEFNMPPCLIRKQDGASLYATRDIASAIYRAEELKCDLNLYVVGVDQNLHFQQIFKVLEKMGYEWAKNCHHIAFGMYRFKDLGKMSTRKGNVIFMEDVVTRAIQMVREVIAKKNPDLEDKETVARQVGVGAIIFNDLVNDRVKNVDFDWERVLDFEGDSGPYVQYCQVRCRSVIKKYGKPAPKTIATELNSKEEKELIRLLLAFDETLSNAFNHFKPHILATYLLDVCRSFNHFYHAHRILGENADLEASRITLVSATQSILERGLAALNIESPKAM